MTHTLTTRIPTHEYTHTNSTLMIIFKDWANKSLRLTKSLQTPRYRREHRLLLKTQTLLNPKTFAPMRVKPGTWDATETLVTTRLHALSHKYYCSILSVLTHNTYNWFGARSYNQKFTLLLIKYAHELGTFDMGIPEESIMARARMNHFIKI